MMRFRSIFALFALAVGTQAATLVFDENPPSATNVPFTFDLATDVLAFDPAAFGVGQINFASGLDTAIPTTGVNTVVLLNTGSPFLAGTAQDLIANRITDSGPGFFVYFNTNLNVPRLVFVNDLGDPASSFTVLARFTNLTFADMPSFQSSNFAATPEPSTLLLTAAGGLLTAAWRLRRSR